MARVKIEKNIYLNDNGDYAIHMNRKSLGGMYYDNGYSSLEDVRMALIELTSAYPKEPNTGAHNNYCRSGRISSIHNHSQLKIALQKHDTFTCNRCKNTLPINKLNVHHIDHNRDNDDKSNFEILCTYCHRKHHNILGYDTNGKYGYISKSSETIPNGSTSQVNGDGSGVSDE